MDGKLPKLNLFHTNISDIEEWAKLDPASFADATSDEKESMVEKHKSISYWKDAWRRFRHNTVSMVALVVFIILVLFAFGGPYLIPYNYQDQYRDAMKLGPGEYSVSEQAVIGILETADAAYSNNMLSGSITTVKKGDYCFECGGDWYSFNLAKKMKASILVFDADAAEPLVIIDEESFLADGVGERRTVEFTVSPSRPDGDYEKLDVITKVFPHYFGTDSAGRDIMARCMYGARVSLLVGIVASLIVLVIGATYGSISGLCGGTVDFLMMRLVDVIYSVPDVLIVLLLQVVLQQPLQDWFDGATSGFVRALGTLGVGIVSIFITFGLLYWVGMSRIIRGQVLMLKQQEYVTAATVLGASNRRIIKRHLLPNCVGQLVITTCLQIPSAIFLESFLSFLGLGISAPMSSLGSMCSEAIDVITLYPYRLIFPAILLSLIVLSLNLVGDGLRDALDPRLKK